MTNGPFSGFGDKFNWLRVLPKEVKELHTNDDVDSGKQAHHHTIGEGIHQAASGFALKSLTALVSSVVDRVTNLEAKELPVGHVIFGYYSTAPAGYLKCDGTAFSMLTYPDLAALLGSTNTPDFRDRVPVGASGTKPVGALNGSDTVTIGSANLPNHTHTMAHDHNMDHGHQSTSSATAGGSTLAFLRSANTSTTTGGGMVANFSGSTGASSAANTGNGGFANTAMDVKPKSLALNYFIKAA